MEGGGGGMSRGVELLKDESVSSAVGRCERSFYITAAVDFFVRRGEDSGARWHATVQQ